MNIHEIEEQVIREFSEPNGRVNVMRQAYQRMLTSARIWEEELNKRREHLSDKDILESVKTLGWLQRQAVLTGKELDKLEHPVKPKVKFREGYIYILRGPNSFKIGKSARLAERTRLLNVNLPIDVSIEHSFHCEDAQRAETILHRQFKLKRLKGEWFALNDIDMAFLKSIVEFRDKQFIITH